jgi:hypothetical protein
MIGGKRHGRGRRLKSKAPNRMTADDVIIWRRLIQRARAVAAEPMGDAIGFVQTAEKAVKCCPPDGHRHVESPFVALTRLGMRFLLLTLVQRADAVPDILAWCDVMDAALVDTSTDARPYDNRRPVKPHLTVVPRKPYAEGDQ